MRSNDNLESLTPRDLQQRIAGDGTATRRLLAYLDARGIAHSGQISGSTLAAVTLVTAEDDDDARFRHGRTWRKWLTAGAMPIGAKRALICAAFCKGAR